MIEQNRYCDNRNIFIKDHNLLFFKIPKVAITSTWQIAANLLGHNLYLENQLRQFRLPEIPTRKINEYDHIYKVGFVRNPWDRLLSCFLQKKNTVRSSLYVMDYHRAIVFKSS